MEIKIQSGKYVVMVGNSVTAAFQTRVEAEAYIKSQVMPVNEKSKKKASKDEIEISQDDDRY